MRLISKTCAAMMILAVPALHAQPTSYTVNALGDDPAVNPGDGTALTIDGEITLRSAMMTANVDGSESVIDFDGGLFIDGAVDLLVGSTLPTVTTSMIIEGPGSDLLTVNSTGSRVFEFQNSPSATIQGMTITGSTQGAVGNSNSLLFVRNCTLRDNDGFSAGLVGGGAIDNNSSGRLRIIDSVIGPNNTAEFSGAIDNFVGINNEIVAINSTFVGNRAGDTGAVLYNGGGPDEMGGNNTALFINCTMNNNLADEDAGVLFQDGPNGGLTLINCTVVGNSASRFFGAIFLLDNETCLFINTIVTDNIEQGGLEVNIDGTVSSDSAHNFIGENLFMDGITNGVNGNQIGTPQAPINPQLLALGDNGGPVPTMLPMEGSPVIDTGTVDIPEEFADFGVTTDARGLDRLQGTAVDIGAVEVQQAAPVIPGDYNGDGVVNVADVTALANHIAFGAAVEGDPDYNGDGQVNEQDVQDLAEDIANGTVAEP